MKDKQKATTVTTAKRREGFTSEERAAMKQRVKEMKVAGEKADGESAVREKIAEMSKSDRATAERLHALIKATVPTLTPRLWYGMPAYANNGETICFFQPAEKFKTRYSTLGFSDKAHLDEGSMWPNAYALTELTPADEKRIGALIKKAVS